MRRKETSHKHPIMTLLLTVLLVVGIGVVPSVASLSQECIDCHGSFADVHGSVNHNAEPASGMVTIFADNEHDDTGWYGPKPYFAVSVDCGTCHASDLLAIHANRCATCHPSPYDTLKKTTWGGGCQQGGCHSAYHADSTVAHSPFEDTFVYLDCNICHDNSWAVPQSKCLNCHATYGAGDISPPVTSTNALTLYNGAAKIVFSITDNGKVGIGTTFYRLDGGPELTGSYVVVSAPGAHELEFWSVDQAGNIEAPKKIYFSIVEDTTPPTTTSDAKPTYTQGALITLTATDDSPQGVKNTYFFVNGGPTQIGTSVSIPATNGTVNYTLTFWSEDWSGNIEKQQSVSFTVTSGSGTLRLVWGNSDASGSPCPSDPDASARWTIRSGSWSGPVVASGSGACPNWSGVDDVIVPVSATPYFVRVDWWESDDEGVTHFPNVYVTTPGQIIRLGY
jgi:hypothetical protein